MLNGNSGNNNWKQKLDDTEGLATETLKNKNAAWELLHSRLSQKPRRQRAVWYRVAAACLLIMITIGMFTVTDKQPAKVNNTTIQLPSINTIPVTPQNSKETQAAMIPFTKTNNIASINTAPAVNKNSTDHHANPAKRPSAAINLNEPHNMPADIQTHTADVITEASIPAATESVIAAIPQQKKLKVVHINELGEAEGQVNYRMPAADYGVIQVRLINQQVYAAAPLPISKSVLTISKKEKHFIKLN